MYYRPELNDENWTNALPCTDVDPRDDVKLADAVF